MTISRTAARASLGAAAVAALTLASAPIAPAQLPEGVDPAEVQSMIPSEVSVRAGETTTVDLGVPVDVNYSSGGWQVSSSGTQVTVTAPDSPGATASVPASAGGMTATVNLVAVGAGEPADADDAAVDGGSDESAGGSDNGDEGDERAEGANGAGGSTGGAGEPEAEGGGGEGRRASESGGTGAAAGGDAAAARADRKKAEEVDTSGAKRLAFDGEIDGNTLVVKVSLRKARDLMKYANADREGAKLRYVDGQGNIITGVERDVNVSKRTLTLTYPEGETPDSPFIMEVVRDGKAEFIAEITATNAPVAEEGDERAQPVEDQGGTVDSSSKGGSVVPLVIGSVALLAALALIVVFFVRRARARG